MTQQRSAVDILSDKQFASNLVTKLVTWRVRKAMRGFDFTRDRLGINEALARLVMRYPHLFTQIRSTGRTTEQIVEHFYNKLVKICQ